MAYNVYFSCDICGIEGGAWCNTPVGITFASKYARKRKWSIRKDGSWICPDCREKMKKQHNKRKDTEQT